MPSLRDGWNLATRTARLMVGVPDYDAYVAHQAAHHPEAPLMDLATFHRNRVDRRYGGGPDRVPRCC
ncbi:CstA-like transporter-associated (seleno)protein [Sphingomonas sp. GM_Shp_2]|uniref:YbdD/YjiX family protein n=1 Tax=Sphingomonas sp. GM_Shp_2 TaxID=2937380 RepID=UPI00226A977A|nr:CstA-like transporter-associated (seleno)protein [Sphingomonas sp. GM_Shp_2]